MQGNASDIDLHSLFVAGPSAVITIAETLEGVAEEPRADSDQEQPDQHAGNLHRAVVSRRNLLAMTKASVTIKASMAQKVGLGLFAEKQLKKNTKIPVKGLLGFGESVLTDFKFVRLEMK